MSSSAARKCLCCNEMFHPDARNRRHQQYCAKDPCRKASKAARQARWLAKPVSISQLLNALGAVSPAARVAA